LNLVSNPSFESGQAMWTFVRPGPGTSAAFLDRTASRTGQASARLDHVPNGNCPDICGIWTEPIPVTPGQEYQFTVWFKVNDDLIGRSGVYVTMRVPDPAGNYHALFAFPTGTSTPDWTPASRSLRIPASVTSIVLDISPWRNIDFPNAQGTIWIDDVSVR
jgi:hypothetical protein